IIPKINVQAPVIYGLPNLNEDTALNALKSGVIHYPLQGATAYPGQNGNSVFLGHSSSDIFNNGKYKFIFVQLDRLTTGDLFYINYNSVQYTYKVTKTEVVAPTDVGALALGTDKPRASLITCDPPGTARNRLIVIGDQINPDPGKAASTQKADDSGSTNKITGTPPTLFEKIFGG
ncbi:MAG: sortase, partial [Candidatus Nomurabacteria bacterium]|nr:sortase [Candidatus Nomurabacteria bacterium]